METNEEELNEFSQYLTSILSEDDESRAAAERYFNSLRENNYIHFVFLCYSIISRNELDESTLLKSALIILSDLLTPSIYLTKEKLFENWNSIPPDFRNVLVEISMKIVHDGPDDLVPTAEMMFISFYNLQFPSQDATFAAFGEIIKNTEEDVDTRKRFIHLVEAICRSSAQLKYEWVSDIHEMIFGFLDIENDFSPDDIMFFVNLLDSIYINSFLELSNEEVLSEFLRKMSVRLGMVTDQEELTDAIFKAFSNIFTKTYGEFFFPGDALIKFVECFIESENVMVLTLLLRTLCRCARFEKDKKERNQVESTYNSILSIELKKSPQVIAKFKIKDGLCPFIGFMPALSTQFSVQLINHMMSVPDEIKIDEDDIDEMPVPLLAFELLRTTSKLGPGPLDKLSEFMEREESDSWQYHYNNLEVLTIFSESEYAEFKALSPEQIESVTEMVKAGNDPISDMGLNVLFNYHSRRMSCSIEELFDILTSLGERDSILISKCAKMMNTILKDRKDNINADLARAFLDFSESLSDQYIKEMQKLTAIILNVYADEETIKQYSSFIMSKVNELFSVRDCSEEVDKERKKDLYILLKLSQKFNVIIVLKEEAIEIIKSLIALMEVNGSLDFATLIPNFYKYNVYYGKAVQYDLTQMRNNLYNSRNQELMLASSLVTSMIVNIKMSDAGFTVEDCESELAMLLAPLMDENCREESYPIVLHALSQFLQTFSGKSPYKFIKQSESPEAKPSIDIIELSEGCVGMIFEAFAKVNTFNFVDEGEEIELTNQILRELFSCYTNLILYYYGFGDFLQKNIRKIFSFSDKISKFSFFNKKTIDEYGILVSTAKMFSNSNQCRVYMTRKNIVRPLLIYAAKCEPQKAADIIEKAIYFKEPRNPLK